MFGYGCYGCWCLGCAVGCGFLLRYAIAAVFGCFGGCLRSVWVIIVVCCGFWWGGLGVSDLGVLVLVVLDGAAGLG